VGEISSLGVSHCICKPNRHALRQQGEKGKFKTEFADPNFQKGTHTAALEGEKYFSHPTTDKQCEVPH